VTSSRSEVEYILQNMISPLPVEWDGVEVQPPTVVKCNNVSAFLAETEPMEWVLVILIQGSILSVKIC
jgi:hypothetical protein